MTSRRVGTTVAYGNTVMRHFVAKIVFLGGSREGDLKRKTISDRETLE